MGDFFLRDDGLPGLGLRHRLDNKRWSCAWRKPGPTAFIPRKGVINP
ncbi:hypothetical protein [Cereibacter changlensis]|nr:hypothetical protein [Cereibacter changlensis]